MNITKVSREIRKWIALYLGAVSCIVIPLYMKHGYIKLIYWKAHAYLVLAVPAVVIAAAAAAVDVIASIRARGPEREAVEDSKNPGRKLRIRESDISVIILIMIALWSLFSTSRSLAPDLSLMGTIGWSVGSLMTTILVLSTIIVSRHIDFRSYYLLPVMAVNVFINAFALIQSARIDLFGLLGNIAKKYFYTYLSTIGHMNSYSGFLCLVLPLFWGAFVSCKDRATEWIYGTFAALGFMGIIVADTDSAYAGIGVCTIFILLYIFGSEQYVQRSSVLLVLYGLSLLIFRYLPVFAKKRARFKGVAKLMIGRPVAEILFIGGILLYFFGWKLIRGRRGKYVLLFLESLILLTFVGFAIHTATHFSDKWGTNRGWIWRVGWEYFLKLPLHRKLTGVGPEMLMTVYTEIRAASGKNVVSAHCEPLQVLLTQGIVGLGIYIAFWGHLLRLFIKKKLWRQNTAVFFFPLAAYWGQSLFCSVYPVTAVLFSFAAGLYLRFAETPD